MAANLWFAVGDFGGKCERGLPPLTIRNDQSELAAAPRQRRAREFRFPSQERLGVGSPDPSPSRSGVSVRLSPHFGSPSQERLGVGSPDPSPSRSGVSVRLSPHFGSPSQERLGVGSPDPSPSRSGVSVRLSPHFGSPSQERLGVGSPDPSPSRSGVSVRLSPHFGSPSQERLGVGSPDPSPSRSGVSVRLSPHFGNPARSAGRSGRGAHLQTDPRRTTHQNRVPPFRTARPPEVGGPLPQPQTPATMRTGMIRRTLPAAILSAGFLGAPHPASAESRPVRAAVAANFTAAAREIGTAFEEATGDSVLFSFGSTGQLYAQIAQGAPFEVFLAADEERPRRAERDRLAVPGSRRTYALGRLVLFSAEEGRIRGPDALRDPGLRRIALANPALAPYGRAALEVLRALGLETRLQDRQVIGTNVSQAHQFVRTGNAELGFLALSQVAQRPGGSRWLIPDELHSPIRQQAVLLEPGRTNPAASRFLDFLASAASLAVLRRHGYRTE